MAWVTVLGPCQAQIDYRLSEGAGCDQVAYHLADDGARGELAGGEQEQGRGLTWIGSGLAQLGLEGKGIAAGLPLTAEHHKAAQALTDGCHPGTGVQLVEPKKASHPLSRLAAIPLLQALQQAAGEADVTVETLVSGVGWAVKRAGRLARGVERHGAAHQIPIGDAERLAAVAGVDLDDVYDADRLQAARAHRDARVRVGNRGYDLTLDLPKSVSVLYGLAGDELARGIEDAFAEAVADVVAAVEQWAGYGIRGQKGEGKSGTRVDGTGLMGWIMWHRSARPVRGQVADPHLHAHVMFAGMLRGTDGTWGVFGDGGRDLHRHVKAVGTLVQARLRRLLSERYGIAWRRDEHTGAWEIAGVGAELRALFSKRGGQAAAELLAAMGLDDIAVATTVASTAQRKAAGAKTRAAKDSVRAGPVDARTSWREQARAAGTDPAALTAACLAATPDLAQRPSPAEIAAWIWRPQDGLTGHTKTVSRADVLAEVMDALPDGVEGLADADALTDQVLRHSPVLPLETSAGAATLSNGERYTSTDITGAEQDGLAAARAGYGAGLAVVDEGAIVDDRQLATLLSEAARTRTKVVLIGDPVQLRAIGVGGLFAAIHRQVDGAVLGENRRQRDAGERAALALWRAGRREQALRTWSQAGRVHAGRQAEDTMARMLADWQRARARYAGDVHAELAAVALLAGSNADVDRLNGATRAVRRAAGEITGPETRYRQAGGRTLALAVGDHVRVHKNDYRARRGQGGADVLNGYRGRVQAIDDQRRVLVVWRAPHPDGPRLQQEWITPDYIAAGGLSYGTAMTVAATQGVTVERALVYGMSLDPHSLYAAMSRDREAVRLYLPRELLETDADRARLGEADGYPVELQRALAAYAATLRGDRADRLVTAEPDPIAHQHTRQHAERATELERAPQADARRAVERLADWARDRAHRDADRDAGREGAAAPGRDDGGRQDDAERTRNTPSAGDGGRLVDQDAEGLAQARQRLQDTEREATAAVRRASALLALSQLPRGFGLLTDAQLAARRRPLTERVTAATAALQSAEQAGPPLRPRRWWPRRSRAAADAGPARRAGPPDRRRRRSRTGPSARVRAMSPKVTLSDRSDC